ncbi:MAG: phosphoribosyltransferase family protein [Anaerovoracaceae bacterium]|jgi:adenine phosphoribosyltransferase
MPQYYEMEIAGLKRRLQLFPVSEDTSIAALILFGDVELTVAAARELLNRAPDFDLILTAEAKSIPLVFEMSRQSGRNEYVVARKGHKVYMEDALSVPVDSITTEHPQRLYLGSREVRQLKGRRVLIVDDVISTGESLRALERLAAQCGCSVVGRMAILAEGDSIDRPGITALGRLPLFRADGTIRG